MALNSPVARANSRRCCNHRHRPDHADPKGQLVRPQTRL